MIGNPPYVRLEDIPAEIAGHYRAIFPTMRGRADLYVAFFEAALRQLKPGGVCGYICADRWMLNQYGADLRRLITSRFGVEVVVEMHNAPAFDDDVSAYPAITVIRRGPQSQVVVASVGSSIEANGGKLARTLQNTPAEPPQGQSPGLTVAAVDRWFSGADPWPCHPPRRLALLRRLEDQFEPLESEVTKTRVGIGVATGLDRVYVTREGVDVEESRLLPLALAQDTTTGQLVWSGHHLINPWQADGLVDLGDFPRLRAFLERHGDPIRPRAWLSTPSAR